MRPNHLLTWIIFYAFREGATSWNPSNFAKTEEMFIIGDLHADIHCAKQWVYRSNMVDLSSWKWIGADNAALVFMGDYVDRGPFGRQVLEFVRNLTVSFPQKVVAMMGNHDLYTLADAMLPEGATLFMGAAVKDFSYAFVHPEEYLNWIPDAEKDDARTLMPSFFAALQQVYAQNYESAVMLKGQRSNTILDWPPFRFNHSLSSRFQEQLLHWQSLAVTGLKNTKLTDWLAARPVVVVLGGVLLVHGGLPSSLGLQRIHELREAGAAVKVEDFFSSGRQQLLDDMHEVVTYRGFHGRKGCKEVDQVLSLLKDEGVKLIVVGHTPGNTVRKHCRDRLVAADSSLSRFYRAYGNRYCPVQVAADRHGTCNKALSPCAGQAVHVQNGNINLIGLDNIIEEL